MGKRRTILTDLWDQLNAAHAEISRLRTDVDKEIYSRTEHWRSSVEALQEEISRIRKENEDMKNQLGEECAASNAYAAEIDTLRAEVKYQRGQTRGYYDEAAKALEERNSIRQREAKLVEALKNLKAEVSGLVAFEPLVRDAIGNTNYNVLMLSKNEAVVILSKQQGNTEMKLTDAQIKHMVDRFLGWRLPENFTPDCGISFKASCNENTAYPSKHEPTGTNLFSATQAEAMVRYMIEGNTAALEANNAGCSAFTEEKK